MKPPSTQRPGPVRALVFLTDGYGGRGGIAAFCRDLLAALSSYEGIAEVTALPLCSPLDEPELLPPNLRYVTATGRGSKLRYAFASIRTAFRLRRERRAATATPGNSDVVISAHINLLPVAALAARILNARLALVIYGIEAWRPTRRWLVNRLAGRVDALISISEHTLHRFERWCTPRSAPAFTMPPAVDLARFHPGPKSSALLERYSLAGRTVLLTVARLSAAEQNWKGIDDVLLALPRLAEEFRDISYLIVGTGDDAERLKCKVVAMGLESRVIFAGHVPDHEKPDHYRLADLFVMAGRAEGFGIAYLEALACGLPVIGSNADASRETLGEGRLGTLVTPGNAEELREAIGRALRATARTAADDLRQFSTQAFERRCHSFARAITAAAQ